MSKTRCEEVIDHDAKQATNALGILDVHGKPARKALDTACPRCGAGHDKRVASGGFGLPHPVCGVCGLDFTDERWSLNA